MFALGQVEVVEAESMIVPAERYQGTGIWMPNLISRQARIFGDGHLCSFFADADILCNFNSCRPNYDSYVVYYESRHEIEMLDRKCIMITSI